jgi:hypothetical protein
VRALAPGALLVQDSGTHAIAGHAPAALPQMPQLALQQRWPTSQVRLPHATPASALTPPSSSGTQLGPLAEVTQCLP